jgi:pyruvate carboxylase
LNALVDSLRFNPRETEIDPAALRELAHYWQAVREFYTPFESDMKAPDSDLYLHEMPGGQFTNLQEQARALGLMARWPEICQTYAAVNQLLGDIVKVTPTSKAVGDMALFLVTNNLRAEDVLDPDRDLALPESVIDLLAGRMGQNPGGFPAAVRKRVLRDQKPVRGRPGATLPPADFGDAAEKVKKLLDREPTRQDVVSYLLYPRVFQDFSTHEKAYSDTSMLPTPAFLYSQQLGEELSVDIEPGKTLILKLLTISEPHADGRRTVFFELNGQPRSVNVSDRTLETTVVRRPKADPADAKQIAAPMPGLVVGVAVKIGDAVRRGQKLMTLEAMKMETTLYAEQDGRVAELLVKPGTPVEAGELVARMQ